MLRKPSPDQIMERAESAGIRIAHKFYTEFCLPDKYTSDELITRCAQYFMLFLPDYVDELNADMDFSAIAASRTQAPPFELQPRPYQSRSSPRARNPSPSRLSREQDETEY